MDGEIFRSEDEAVASRILQIDPSQDPTIIENASKAESGIIQVEETTNTINNVSSSPCTSSSSGKTSKQKVDYIVLQPVKYLTYVKPDAIKIDDLSPKDGDKLVKVYKGRKRGRKQLDEVDKDENQTKVTDSYQPTSAKAPQEDKPCTRRSNGKPQQLAGAVKDTIAVVSDTEADGDVEEMQNQMNKLSKRPTKGIASLKATRMKGKEQQPIKNKNMKRTVDCITLSDGDEEPAKKKRTANLKRPQERGSMRRKKTPIHDIDAEDKTNGALSRHDPGTDVALHIPPKDGVILLEKAAHKGKKYLDSCAKKEENVEPLAVSSPVLY